MDTEFLTVQGNCERISQRPIEIAERKGLGHPDTLADGIAESVSMAYSQYCLQRYGAVLHHNVDKIAIIGGRFKSTAFGLGEMIAPVKVVFNGRMSTSFAGEKIDIDLIQENAARDYLNKVLPRLDVHKHLEFEHYTNDYARYDTWFRPRSLEDLPELRGAAAADASISVGYWPLTPTERLTLALEQCLNGPNRNLKFNYTGQDIKVLSYRNGSTIRVTMAIPFLSEFTTGEDFYFEKKNELSDDLIRVAYDTVGTNYDVKLEINTQEKAPFKNKRIYMLAIGSCIEAGEEGVVGRGNPPIGVISTHRPHSMEAPFGKNPVYHAGKVYSYLVMRLAKAISQEFECETTVYAISKNGSMLFPPPHLLVETSGKEVNRGKLKSLIEDNFLNVDYVSDIVQKGALMPA